jgi:soluble lytic murein transglycosylase-like protein
LRSSGIAALAALAATAAAAPASAAPHVVAPGDTLSGIAAANGISTEELAAANGLAPDGHVILGTTVEVPVADSTGTEAAPPAMGGYVVQPGETLSGIAAASGISVDELAWMNGLDPAAPLIAGTALKLPTATSTSAAPTNVVEAAPNPTPGFTSSSEVASIASQHGVSGSLAAAVAYQESGFNNGVVSSANARGVMQVMPGTWEWVEQNLAGPLDPNSTQDNIRAGSLYLGQLLQDTGGDERMAVAAYYQGLGSVRENGLLPETEQYVNNVMALRGRFGGP